MQKEDHSRSENYKGEMEAAKDITRRHGVRGLYLGFNCTLIRELIAMGIYFTCFELTRRHMEHDREGSWKEKFKIMTAGSIAGLASWILTYPIDFVKTKLQSQDLDRKTYRGTWHCFTSNLKEHGPRIFTRGLSTACLRSIPVNAVGFLVED